MFSTTQFFTQLAHRLHPGLFRCGIVAAGDTLWQQQCVTAALTALAPSQVFQLGGHQTHGAPNQHVTFKQGQQLLGQECELLICDMSSGFDANSFSAALGALKGGGVLIVLPESNGEQDDGARWLELGLRRLTWLIQGQALPALPEFPSTHEGEARYAQQQDAIGSIIKVVEGHRKRPLVLTADRGRGKSSALGLAAAQLMQARPRHIVVTAPRLANVSPVFDHAARQLPDVQKSKTALTYQGATLTFVAPDELLRQPIECDLLLVDEASAIPLPMLKRMVQQYHRLAFSTTIHGYEGCGRGFTLKFQHWLRTERPGARFIQLDQPIRWGQDDPLELWLYQTFLLDCELTPLQTPITLLPPLIELSKAHLLATPGLVRQCFALLVNAHYQTSPNDLFHLLSDSATRLFALLDGDVCLGCLLVVEEGGLDEELIGHIQRGTRRPKGHLTPVTLANQLGCAEAATERSVRIMRIAVHPDGQRQGWGTAMLRQLDALLDISYLSTSFGATSDLIQFWQSNDFVPLKLGSQRDQASGCHSLLMVKGQSEWIIKARPRFEHNLVYQLSDSLKDIEPDNVRSLLPLSHRSVMSQGLSPLIEFYLEGGSSFDSVAPMIRDCILTATPARLENVSDLMVRKIVQQWSWQACAIEFSMAGRKQVEAQLRHDLRQFTL
ncbi:MULTISPECIES: tRNA(Met) cytidine acetyltransferase TmcA [unclassified Vibrio]|uniref:tRNA(Met) cytidine acetyltransferase TmcA n=1 Tax=unclassified Vibrio TaxID=2614977 RepID=UPI001361EDB8|nr:MULTISPECIES: GNAT family N-acetyltransferase [unclassified Vibrio]NAW56234.1 GNAT family N-acetyltransferase [Vibrio sp. V36_P2S2PM302]NAX25508.1 GNAT family N-acetyltransferase [Vibrio sp. V38_P2S17PM301]NAX31409.1 GNAT family N-acetyltransferase [Vibrio sp. V37_P2S8PM304]